MNPPAAPAYSNLSGSRTSGFRRHGGDRPVAVERADQRIEPPLGHFDIGIEQYEILGVQPGERRLYPSA